MIYYIPSTNWSWHPAPLDRVYPPPPPALLNSLFLSGAPSLSPPTAQYVSTIVIFGEVCPTEVNKGICRTGKPDVIKTSQIFRSSLDSFTIDKVPLEPFSIVNCGRIKRVLEDDMNDNPPSLPLPFPSSPSIPVQIFCNH